MTIYYTKNPDGTFSPAATDAVGWTFPKGITMVVVNGCCTSYRYQLNPDYAMLEAMICLTESEINKEVSKLFEECHLRYNEALKDEKFAEKQRKAFERYKKDTGESEMWLYRSSIAEFTKNLMKVLHNKAEELKKA